MRARPLAHGLTAAFAALAVAFSALPAQAAPAAPVAAQASTDPAMQGAREAFDRILGDAANQFDLATLPAAAKDSFSVSAVGGRIQVAATTPATALRGLNTYLGTVGQSISWTVSNVRQDSVYPLPTAPVTATALVSHRFVGNDTEDGYTGAYRSYDEWVQQIDELAALGYNEIFMPVGSEAVYFDVLQQFGYSKQDILKWIPTPSHQPWWLLQNMYGFPAGMTEAAIDARAQLGHKIVAHMKELGVKPVLPGFFGTVPTDFASRNAGATTVPQGGWVGFERSSWLDPNSAIFPQVAAAFYASSTSRLGASSGYKMDVLHEGGVAGNVDVPRASKAIEAALQKAHPGATWYLLGWQSNPPATVLNAVDKKTTFVVDGLSDRRANRDGEKDFVGTPWAFGSIWNFGGDTTMGAKIKAWSTLFPAMRAKTGSTLDGIAAMPEGGLNNAAALDFMADLAWTPGTIDVPTWFDAWTVKRYGVANADAQRAWRIIADTAYTLPTAGSFAEAQDSIYAADPSMNASNSSTWSPGFPTYDFKTFATALAPLTTAGTQLKDVPAYRYDLMDVSRQVLSNTGRQLLPKINMAFTERNAAEYDRLTSAWLSNMDLLDKIAGTQDIALLGRLLDEAKAAGPDAATGALYEVSQRTILTTWAPRAGYDYGLGDYAGREIQGLIKTYYQPRWKKFFDDGRAALAAGTTIPRTDWFTWAQPWLTSTSREGILSSATGDIMQLVQGVPAAVALAQEEPPVPLPPGNGTTYLSDLRFWKQQVDAAYGPIERDTEVGQAAAGDGKPITLNGVVYKKGLGMQAPAWVTFNLGGQCSRFQSVVGPDDIMSGAAQNPSITFIVSGDGKQLVKTAELLKKQTATIDLDVTGVKELKLAVDPGASYYWDRADWADAKVTCAVDAGPKLTDIVLSTASLDLEPGATAQVTVAPVPATASNAEYAWTSADPSVATVTASGQTVTVTGVAAGTTEITVVGNPGAITKKIAVTVAAPAPTLDLSAVATVRCVAGTPYLSVATANGSAVPIDLTVQSALGAKTVTGLAPGKISTLTLKAGSKTVAAGTVTVAAAGTVAGVPATGTTQAAYPALTCG